MYPGYEEQVLEVHGDHRIIRGGDGVICETDTPRLSVMPAGIAGDGTVSKVEVSEPSGNTGFDLAAMRAVELATMPSPLAFGIPGELHEASVIFVNRPD
jgi:hypothetical protein